MAKKRQSAAANITDRKVGKRLKELREKAGLSQEAVGKILKVTYQQVQKYENGQDRIGAGQLGQLAIKFKIPVAAFFSGVKKLRLAA